MPTYMQSDIKLKPSTSPARYLGVRIFFARLQSGYTIGDLAGRAKIDLDVLNDIECGTQEISLSQIEKICFALRKQPSFFTGTP